VTSKEQAMKQFTIAAAVVLGLAVFTWVALRAIPVPAELVGSVYETALPVAVAQLILGGVTYLHQVIAHRQYRPRLGALPLRPAPFADYLLPWPVALIYGVFMVIAANALGVLLVWLVGTATGIYPTQAIPYLNALSVTVVLYLVAGWVAARSQGQAFLVVVLILALGLVVTLVLDRLAGLTAIRSSASIALVRLGLYPVAALAGWWRGRAARGARYIVFLLKFVRPGARPALLDRLHAEIQTEYDKLAAPAGTYAEGRSSAVIEAKPPAF
jgi:hypothetical protein